VSGKTKSARFTNSALSKFLTNSASASGINYFVYLFPALPLQKRTGANLHSGRPRLLFGYLPSSSSSLVSAIEQVLDIPLVCLTAPFQQQFALALNNLII